MDELSTMRRMALFNLLMAYGMALMGTKFVERFTGEPGLADDLEQMAAQVARMKNVVPSGWTIEEEADAIGQATREFNNNIAQWVSEIRKPSRMADIPDRLRDRGYLLKGAA